MAIETAASGVQREQAGSERVTRILVVESHAALRWLTAVGLRHLGYEVMEAEDGGAIGRLGDEDGSAQRLSLPDILVSDAGVSGSSGIECVRLLRKRGLRIPAILLSAYPARSLLDAAAALESVKVLPKPVDLERLAAHIQETLRNGGGA